jgi:dUTP pyrophosphatase
MSSNSTLYINANDNVKIFYTEHSTFHEGDSGLDLFFPNDITIKPGDVVKVDLGIACEMIEESLVSIETIKKCDNIFNILSNLNAIISTKNVSYYLYPRSSIANTPLILTNNVGIVDSAYRGTLKAALRNVGSESYTIKRGERLLQICTGDLKPFTFKLVETLSETSRGSNGFGSTGK